MRVPALAPRLVVSLAVPFLVGPGSILDAHTDHERISKKQLLEGVEIYLRLARRLLNSPPSHQGTRLSDHSQEAGLE